MLGLLTSSKSLFGVQSGYMLYVCKSSIYFAYKFVEFILTQFNSIFYAYISGNYNSRNIIPVLHSTTFDCLHNQDVFTAYF